MCKSVIENPTKTREQMRLEDFKKNKEEKVAAHNSKESSTVPTTT